MGSGCRRQGGLWMIGGQTQMRRGNEEVIHRLCKCCVGRTRRAGGEKMSGFGEIAIGMLFRESNDQEANGQREPLPLNHDDGEKEKNHDDDAGDHNGPKHGRVHRQLVGIAPHVPIDGLRHESLWASSTES